MAKYSITKDDVHHIAGLARIWINEQELERYTKNLEDILHYVAKLEQPDITGIEPTSHVLPLKDIYRPDTVRPSFSQEEATQIAVAKQNGSFKVPPVIE
jgi:aspartyl-tRNA(Asn)/glutamyl-tRNA(Gln) amidotransferase subunit C